MPANTTQGPTSGGGTPRDDDLLLDQSLFDALVREAQGADGNRTGVTSEAPTDAGRDSAALSLSKADIDTLLNNDELGRIGKDRGMESVIPSVASVDAGPLDQSNIDAFIAGMSPAASPPSAAPSQSVVSQEMIDALITAAHDESAAPPQTVKPPPEVKKPDEGLPTKNEFDAVLQQAQQKQPEQHATEHRAPTESLSSPAPKDEPAPVPITEKQGKLHRDVKRPRMPRMPVHVEMLRLVTSLAAGVMATAAMFTYLYTHQERTPEPMPAVQLAALRPESETPALPEASTANVEAPPLTSAQADKEFEDLHGTFLALKADAPRTEIDAMHARMTDFIRSAPDHPKLPEVYEWKAALYEREHRTAMVREVYKALLSRFQEIPNLDAVLLGAAKAAIELGQPKEAMDYARRLLDTRGDSPLAPEAELVLADAYAAATRLEDARTIWTRLAKAGPGTPTGLLATARLGQAYIDEGRSADAINLLEPYVNVAGKGEGDELLGFLMARAYRGVGRLEDARRRLNDILTFFGHSDRVPDAMVELSQVLEELGLRSDAIQMARDAAQRFPENPAVLRNEGNLLAANDQKREAAEALLNALQAGMRDPNLLLDAARDFRAAEALPEAQTTYERLLTEFPRAPVAIEAEIELSEIVYERGQVAKGIRQLEELLAVTAEGPQRLPVLFSMAKLYQGLGLKTRTAEIYRQIAGLSNEPEVLARAATALLDGAFTDEGLAVAERVDLKKISEKTAYDLLVSQSQALSSSNAQRSFECLEKAYAAYPKQRTPEFDRKLMAAYASRDDAPHAQEMLSSLDAQVKETPADAPRFRDAATVWADHLYDKKDYRAAADWYARAAAGDNGKDPTAAWAAYQLGNALLELDDLAGGAKAFDQVVAAGSEWANDAQIKANYARVEQRLRGQPVTAPLKTAGGRG
ncbi:MAG: tetratricopeptide repeat protein [Candidatus Hydrogenedentes bacterium]|nr:tetratricopeptide repeat protein [Candidatus Hydrogenedentota bacterium]